MAAGEDRHEQQPRSTMPAGRKPISQGAGAEWTLTALPHPADRKPWMVQGKSFRIVIRRYSTMPADRDIAVFDIKSGKLLDELDWRAGAEMFGII